LFFLDNKTFHIAMATIGKLFATSAYAIICLYSVELFPTTIRNSCMGLCNMTARLGSMLAPFINSLVF
jgi:MFS transporter, OCT family, solute carrier family 22 (organic cation transporter), member 4/5